jgi:hypothetical protein
MSATVSSVPASRYPESPEVAAAEARAVAPLLVGGIEAVARSRLLKVTASGMLSEVLAMMHERGLILPPTSPAAQ